MKIVVYGPFLEEHVARMSQVLGCEHTLVSEPKKLNVRDQIELFKDADAIIGAPSPMAVTRCKHLKWLQSVWAEPDLYCNERMPLPDGVVLTGVAGYAYGHIISQFVIGQVLAITQNLVGYIRQQANASWKQLGSVATLEGGTAVIFGAGDIGGHIAKRLEGFDLDAVIGVCRDTSKQRPYFTRLICLNEAEKVLNDSDLVICCMPNDKETSGYFNENRLRLIKSGAVLINVGRGSFVDCDALDVVLREGRLRGAALDVTNPEPLPSTHPLWTNQKCIITPHAAGGAFGKTPETEKRICDICCKNIEHFIRNESLDHVF